MITIALLFASAKMTSAMMVDELTINEETHKLRLCTLCKKNRFQINAGDILKLCPGCQKVQRLVRAAQAIGSEIEFTTMKLRDEQETYHCKKCSEVFYGPDSIPKTERSKLKCPDCVQNDKDNNTCGECSNTICRKKVKKIEQSALKIGQNNAHYNGVYFVKKEGKVYPCKVVSRNKELSKEQGRPVYNIKWLEDSFDQTTTNLKKIGIVNSFRSLCRRCEKQHKKVVEGNYRSRELTEKAFVKDYKIGSKQFTEKWAHPDYHEHAKDSAPKRAKRGQRKSDKYYSFIPRDGKPAKDIGIEV